MSKSSDPPQAASPEVSTAAATMHHQPRRRWTLAGVIGTGVGLLPHVLHHVGLLAGTALIAGLGGTLLFGALGLAATIPMLIRLRRRFASWWAPAIALVIFAVMFSISTFVIGPALRGAMSTPDHGGQPGPTMDPTMHNQHHHAN